MEVKKQNRGHTLWQWFAAITANLTMLTYGMQSAWVSPSMRTLQSENSPTGYPLSDTEISWIGSLLGLSASFSVLPYSYIADRYGRKCSIYAIAGMQALGWAIKLFTANTAAILIARAFCGFAGGGCFVIIPMYVKEIAQDDKRGVLGSLLIMIQNIGVLLIYAFGAYWDYYTVLRVMMSISVFTLLILIKVPESPAYLMKVEKNDELVTTIALLRGLDDANESVHREVDCMKKEDLYYKSLPTISFSSIFKERAWSRAFFLMLGMITFHASNGVFALVTYASSILASSSSFLDPDLQSLSFPCTMILAAVVSMNCVEKLGRKPVLAISLALITASMYCMGTVVLMQSEGKPVAVWIPLAAMLTSVAACAFGLSPVPFIVMSETFNFQIRARAIGVIVTYSWFLCFIQLLIFNPLSTALGLHGVFFFFGGLNLVGLVYCLVLLPETQGKSVEQIEAELSHKKFQASSKE